MGKIIMEALKEITHFHYKTKKDTVHPNTYAKTHEVEIYN